VSDASRLLRGTLPCLVALLAAIGFALPASAQPQAGAAPAARTEGITRTAEWWLTALDVPGAWRAAPAEGNGVIVAVLSTGVDAAQPDLAGDVTIGRDYCDSGRTAASPFWGYEGTAVASLLAGHGHGPGHAHGGSDGITGVAPDARILAVQVTLEYNDPLNSDSAITRRLPDAIAAGIRYAVAHGATVIALPLDPGTLGPAATGDPVAAGGSPAERAAVSYALAQGAVLVAPAGDNGASTGTVNYPAAYPGVVAVGATMPGGRLAPFTSRRSYVALTAPGSGVTVANPDGGYSTLASTDMSAALTAGVAALIRSRFPRLTVAEVATALERGARPAGQHPAPGSGRGALDAAGALAAAATLAAAHAAPAPKPRPAPPTQAPRPSAAHAAARPPGAGPLAGSVLRDAVIAALALIAALACALAYTASRRRRRRLARRGTSRSGQGGSHARRPRALPGQPQAAGQAQMSPWRQPLPLGPGSTASGASHAPGTSGGAFGAVGQPRPLGPGSSVGAPRVVPMQVTGALATAGRTRGRGKATKQPPWEPASQPAEAIPGLPALPAFPAFPAAPGQPLPHGQHAALPPWERAPAEFAAAPAADLPDWPPANTGPMYVWNPNASTGPQPAIKPDDRGVIGGAQPPMRGLRGSSPGPAEP
jgi:hypothetical protein